MIPERPIWQAELPRLARLRPPPRVDVAVVGGGLTGLSAAYHILGRWPGCRLVVLEAGGLGAGASGRSTGMLSPGVGQSLLGLSRRLGREPARRLYLASLQAVQQVAALIEEEGIDCALVMGGQIVWGPSAAARRRLQRQAALMEELGLPVERLDAAALQRRLRLRWPAALQDDGPRGGGSRGAPAALRYPTAGTLDPLALVAGLARAVLRRGGQLCCGTAVASVAAGAAPALRLRDGGEVRADHVVIATAGYSAGLGVQRGRVLPVRLQALATEPLTPAQREALGWQGREGVIDARRLFSYLRLSADGRVVFGGGRPLYGERGGRADDVLAGITGELRRLIPGAPPIACAWSGCIGYVLDGLPVIGPASAPARDARVIQAVGFCGHGVALGTASGAWVAQILADGAPAQELPWHRAAAPRVPTEPARRLGFRAVVGWMGLRDRLEGLP